MTLSSHSVRTGIAIQLTTSGSLPTELSADTTYYCRYDTSNILTLHPTKADAIADTNQITFSDNGSGTHTLWSAFYKELSTDEASDFGGSSGRVYGSMSDWKNERRAVLTASDLEVLVIADPFTESSVALNSFALEFGALRVETLFRGSRTDAFHNGTPSTGFEIYGNYYSVYVTKAPFTLDGIEVRCTSKYGIAVMDENVIRNNIIKGDTVTWYSSGLWLASTYWRVYNNIIINFTGTGASGVFVDTSSLSYNQAGVFYNNIVTKNLRGMEIESLNARGSYSNNIVVGNTEYNWGPSPRYISGYGNVTDAADSATVTADPSTNELTISEPDNIIGRSSIMFRSTDTLPAPLVEGQVYEVYTYINGVFNIVLKGGYTPVDITTTGTGTHYMIQVWCTVDGKYTELDMTTPDDVFVSFSSAPFDFTPAGTSGTPNTAAKQVNAASPVYESPGLDMFDNVRPNYEGVGGSPAWDSGPIEFDHEEGLAPINANFVLTGVPTNAEIRIYENNPATGIIGTVELSGVEYHSGGNYTYNYDYTGTNINIAVQILANGYVENLTYYTLNSSNQTIPIILQAEDL